VWSQTYNPQTGIYALGGLEEHTDAKRQRRHEDADDWNSGTARPVQIARLQREIADGQKKNDCLAVARCVAAHDYIEDTEWAALEPMLIPIHHKISTSNSDGDIKLDTIQNFLRGGNMILTDQQKEAVRQQLISKLLHSRV
jgi:hypothetical protein